MLALGLDIGTTSTRALLCDARGRVVAEAAAAYPTRQPQPGWSEQDPRDWWHAAQRTIRAVLRRVRKTEICAIGVAGQMHGGVFLDASDDPLRPAILWNDQRTTRECAEITRAAGGPAKLIGMVRNPALAGYTAPKLLWMRRNEPRLFKRVEHLLVPKDYIVCKLTGEHTTDMSEASGMLLLDVAKRGWHAGLLRALRIDVDILPTLHESADVVGVVSAAAARATGLRAGTPIVAGAGDQPAAGVGMGIVRPGVVSLMLGTSGVVFAHSDRPVANETGALQSFCHAVPGAWCVFGCMLSAGGSLEWARRTLTSDGLSFDRIIAEAARVEPGAEGLYFLPHLTGERCPWPDPDARGAWIGLTARHGRAHLFRAVLEGITFGLAEQIDLLRASGMRIGEVRVGGGGAKSAWWRQLMADVFDANVVTLGTTQGAAYGAALLAGVGGGMLESVVAASKVGVRIRSRTRPRRAMVRRYRAIRPRLARLYEAFRAERRIRIA